MQRLVQRFREDHSNMHHLLQLFDKEMMLLREPSLDPDYHLLHDIVRYFLHFPDIVHHPAEELMFVFLAKRQPEIAPHLLRLEQQHRTQVLLTTRLCERLEGICSGHIVPRTELLCDAESFLANQLQHMADEDEYVFSRSDIYAGTHAWVQLEADVQARVDPIFGREISQEFATLRDAIFELGEQAEVA